MARPISASMNAIRRKCLPVGQKYWAFMGPAGKITPAMVEKTLKSFIRGEHDPKPAAVSLTNSTELGTTFILRAT